MTSKTGPQNELLAAGFSLIGTNKTRQRDPFSCCHQMQKSHALLHSSLLPKLLYYSFFSRQQYLSAYHYTLMPHINEDAGHIFLCFLMKWVKFGLKSIFSSFFQSQKRYISGLFRHFLFIQALHRREEEHITDCL